MHGECYPQLSRVQYYDETQLDHCSTPSHNLRPDEPDTVPPWCQCLGSRNFSLHHWTEQETPRCWKQPQASHPFCSSRQLSFLGWRNKDAIVKEWGMGILGLLASRLMGSAGQTDSASVTRQCSKSHEIYLPLQKLVRLLAIIEFNKSDKGVSKSCFSFSAWNFVKNLTEKQSLTRGWIKWIFYIRKQQLQLQSSKSVFSKDVWFTCTPEGCNTFYTCWQLNSLQINETSFAFWLLKCKQAS